MEVVFIVSKKLKKMVSKRKKYSLSEANKIVSELDRYSEEHGLKENVVIRIYDNKDIVFTEEFPLGIKKARNIISMVKDTLNTTFSDVPKEQKDQLINLLEKNLRESKGINNQNLKFNSEESSDTLPEIKKSNNEGSKKETKVKDNEVSKRVNFFYTKNKKVIAMLSLLFCILGSLFFFQLYNNYSQAKNISIESKKTFENYFNEKDYLSALELENSQKNIEKVVNQLIVEENFVLLEKINSQYPSVIGTFELAFFKQDWEQVVQIPLDQLNDDRKVMIAHAYIELGLIEEAETLNELIQSSIINQEVQTGYFNRALEFLRNKEVSKAEEIQKSLKNDALEEYISEAKTYIKLIESYERKKEKDNAEQWNKILKNLGKE